MDITDATIFIGVLVVLAGVLGGGARGAVATRRALAPYLRDRPDLSFGAAGLLLLLLFLWDPIEAAHRFLGIVLIAALALFGVQMLRRQTAAEFPEAHYLGGMGGDAAAGDVEHA